MDFLNHKGTCKSIVDWIEKTPCLDNTTYPCQLTCDSHPAGMDLYCTFLIEGNFGFTQQYIEDLNDPPSATIPSTIMELNAASAPCCPFIFIRLVNPEDDEPRPTA